MPPEELTYFETLEAKYPDAVLLASDISTVFDAASGFVLTLMAISLAFKVLRMTLGRV